MAEAQTTSDVIIPLTVDTGGADQSIENLDKLVASLISTLATLTKTSIEYYKVEEQLIQATTARAAANEKLDKTLASVSTATAKMATNTKAATDGLDDAAKGTTNLSDDLDNLYTNLNQSGESAKDAAQGVEWYQQTLQALRSEGGLTNVTLNELKATQKDLEKQMNSSTAASPEWAKYRDDVNEVKAAITSYKALAKDTEGEMKVQANTVAGMRAEVSRLTKEWANTDMASPKFEELSKQLADTTEKLKAQEAAVGNHKRDVGNYGGQIGQLAGQFGVLGNSLKSVTGIIGQVNTAFKALLANPIILVIAGIVTVVMQLVNALKSSEDATQRMNAIMAPLKRILDAVQAVFQSLVGVILSGVEAVMSFVGSTTRLLEKLPFIGKYIKQANEAMAESIQLEKDKYALDQRAREIQVENAKNDRDISELRAKAAEKEKYTAEERLIMIREAGRLEKENADRALEIAKERLRIAEMEAARSENSKEIEEQIAKLRADVYGAEKSYADSMRKLNSQEATFLKELETEKKVAADAAQKRRDDAIAAEKKAAEELAGVQSAITTALTSEFDNRRAAEGKAYQERMAILVANNQSTEELERLHQQVLTQIDADEAEKRSQDAATAYAAEVEKANAAYQAEIDTENIRKEERDARRAEAQAALMAAELANDEELRIAAQERLAEYQMQDEEAEALQREKEAELLQNRLTLLNEQLENERIIGDERIALEQAITEAKNGLALNAAATAKAAADKQLADYKAQIEAEKKIDDERAKNKKVTQGTINSLIEAGTAIAGENTAASKVLNSAQAVMSTWTGAAQALANPFPMNLAAMAATLTAGFMSIKKIWEVKVPGASGAGGSTPDLAVPNIEAQATYQAPIVETHSNITGDEIDEINQAQRVYVVESDISDTQRRVQVVDSEATF